MKTLSRNKTSNAIALFLMMTIFASIVLLPTTSAQSKTQSWALMDVSPNPVGVGQRVAIIMFANPVFPNAAVTNNIRRIDYKLTITKPDGTTEVKTYPVISDPTGVQYISYTPTQVGIYTLLFEYPGQTYIWNQANTPGLSSAAAAYQNDPYGAATATAKFTVQQEPLPN